jgi:surface antigen
MRALPNASLTCDPSARGQGGARTFRPDAPRIENEVTCFISALNGVTQSTLSGSDLHRHGRNLPGAGEGARIRARK